MLKKRMESERASRPTRSALPKRTIQDIHILAVSLQALAKKLAPDVYKDAEDMSNDS